MSQANHAKMNTKPIFITVWKTTHDMLKELSKNRLDPMIKIIYQQVKKEHDKMIVENKRKHK